ncbi:hypothetical protein [Nocardia thraciensis]
MIDAGAVQASDVFVLVHSPMVGPMIWRGVAQALDGKGFRAEVPDLTGTVRSGPYLPRIVAAVREPVLELLDHPPVPADRSGRRGRTASGGRATGVAGRVMARRADLDLAGAGLVRVRADGAGNV